MFPLNGKCLFESGLKWGTRMKVEVEIDTDDVQTYRADDRGRINLGIENANKTVEIAILDVEEDE